MCGITQTQNYKNKIYSFPSTQYNIPQGKSSCDLGFYVEQWKVARYISQSKIMEGMNYIYNFIFFRFLISSGVVFWKRASTVNRRLCIWLRSVISGCSATIQSAFKLGRIRGTNTCSLFGSLTAQEHLHKTPIAHTHKNSHSSNISAPLN